MNKPKGKKISFSMSYDLTFNFWERIKVLFKGKKSVKVNAIASVRLNNDRPLRIISLETIE